jgi:hypothetical protein
VTTSKVDDSRDGPVDNIESSDGKNMMVESKKPKKDDDGTVSDASMDCEESN